MRTLSSFFTAMLLIFLNSSAQVYNGNLTLATQADVDAFNYSEVTGVLSIGGLGTSITNLDGLSTLTKVDLSLLIVFNNSLTNIDGLSNLTSVGKSSGSTNALVISNAPLLTNLDALSNLQYVGSLSIENNKSLTSINGLSNMTQPLLAELSIKNNAVLTNLDGLSNIATVETELTIEDNPSLTNVDG